MSGSGRKDFDVKHILRLRWKLFSHPSPAGGPAGGCLPPDSSFEHWGPSQSRLLKSQERGHGVFWKKSASSSAGTAASPPNGTLLPAGGRPAAGHGPGPPPPRTVFYVESLEEEEEAGAVPGGMEVACEPEQPLAPAEREEAPGGCADGGGGRATGDGCGH
ncbi:KLHL1 protein, partial [Furnarius figulus]|nr:KLHL1 protein [Furnarius figulus]